MSDNAIQQDALRMVSLTIDQMPVTVPEGTVVVDAARNAGINIPTFCHHPKLEPVGMCRMCLVEIGRPVRSRETGELELENDGSPKIQFGPNLETGCTIKVSEGMVVRGYTDKVTKARKDVLEFILTSHPLDCPICDKGGECPLQNVTMEFGPSESRFLVDEKRQNKKRVPLGDLIFLNRERCIHCARCTRFQSEVADDPVIGFYHRGRALEIITTSEPGFNSYFSGNTTDICPVGALTTADFRFGARPWEMNSAASICTHCPVGCNIALNVRREAKSNGEATVKRIIPRQNEAVNEIWLCDKGRFGYHFSQSEERIDQPLIRKGDSLVPSTWDEALDLVSVKFKEAGEQLVTLGSGRLSNEDLFNLHQLTTHMGGKSLLSSQMAGGDLVAQVGVGKGTNFSDMSAGSVIFIIACDLEEEAPIWWLRVKQAAERGALVITANPRLTKADKCAAHTLRYVYGDEAALVLAMLNSISPKKVKPTGAVKNLERDASVKAAAKVFAEAENAIVIYGGEGMGLTSSKALSEACTSLLIGTGHVGRVNNGLIPVWDKGNGQGAWDMGFRPSEDLKTELDSAEAVYMVGTDLLGDDPHATKSLENGKFTVVQELFMTETAQRADVVLPALTFIERGGSYTSGERRVQRFYPAVMARPDVYPDYKITAQIAKRLGYELAGEAAEDVMLRIAESVMDYEGVNPGTLAEVSEQWPFIGRDLVNYVGTSYNNKQGLGVQLQPGTQRGERLTIDLPAIPYTSVEPDEFIGVPITRLYDRGKLLMFSEVLHPRLVEPYIVMNPSDAQVKGVEVGSRVNVVLNGSKSSVIAGVNSSTPAGYILIPRSLGIPVDGPASVRIELE
jgi:NADH-quinone oxidoreductase subunit G